MEELLDSMPVVLGMQHGPIRKERVDWCNMRNLCRWRHFERGPHIFQPIVESLFHAFLGRVSLASTSLVAFKRKQ